MLKTNSFFNRTLWKSRCLTFVLSCLSVMSLRSYASDQDNEAKAKLQAQIDLSKTIRSTLERYDAVRATILIASSQDVIATIDTYHVGHAKTLNAYAAMKITYKSSELFLNDVRSEFTNPLIDDLTAKTHEILADAGLDDDWPMKQIFAMFTNIKNRTDHLRTMRVTPELSQKLVDLNGVLGTTIAKANAEGDRPPAFQQGNIAYCSIIQLNPLLEAIPSNWNEFDEGLMIRALAALYAEYSGINEGSCHP
jgi:hypothetical protein